MDRITAFGDAMNIITVGPSGEESNYSYLIVDNATGDCAVVDPSECGAAVVALLDGSASSATPMKLKQVLTTHHHWDHAFGNSKLAEMYPGLDVIGGEEDEVEACTKRVKHGDVFNLGNRIRITALNTRGHTDGHICYLVTTEDGSSGQAVFTGDTMFVGGCGRCLEGTFEEMWVSLSSTLGSLEPNTKVYVGHEYTVKNLEFGCQQDPNNVDMKARLDWARAATAEGGVTVPSTLAEEWKTNVFLRCADPAFQVAHPDETTCSPCSAVDLFGKMRTLKDGKMRFTQEMLRNNPGMVPGKFRRQKL